MYINYVVVAQPVFKVLLFVFSFVCPTILTFGLK